MLSGITNNYATASISLSNLQKPQAAPATNAVPNTIEPLPALAIKPIDVKPMLTEAQQKEAAQKQLEQIMKLFEKGRCETCAKRTYQDGSNDPGVSMKSPTKVDSSVAAAVVSSHEQEHVTRNAAQAQSEGREVVASSVTIHTAICPECGKNYVSGGTTKTTTAAKQQYNTRGEQNTGNNELQAAI